MRIKKFLIVFFIFISVFAGVAKAQVSNTYKQGVYDITEFGEYTATATLITPNNRTSLTILDDEGDIKFFKEFNTVNETVNLGIIKKGNTISIVGTGEIAIVTK